MSTYIVLIPVGNFNPRGFANIIENDSFATLSEFQHVIKEYEIEDALIYAITDFMDAINDQEISMDEYFMSYIQIKK